MPDVVDPNTAKESALSSEDEQTTAIALGVEAAGRVWAIDERVGKSLLALAGRRLSGGARAALTAATAPARQPAQPQGGVAVVPLKGLLMGLGGGGGLMALLFGGGGLTAFQSQLRQAVADSEVDSIVLDVDSPGGWVDHIPEVAADVRAARQAKPVVAVANTMAASAAYWLASQADEIVVTPSGDVGSVGVYQLHEDISKALTMEGIALTFITAGEYKVEGNPYEPLSDTAATALQQDVSDYYEMFVTDVAAGRGVAVPSLDDGKAFGGGRSLLANRAKSAGLADRVDTLEHTISRLQSPAGRAAIERRRAELAGRDDFSATPSGGAGEEDGGRRLKVARTPDEINGLLVLAPSPSPNSTKEGMPA